MTIDQDLSLARHLAEVPDPASIAPRSMPSAIF